MNARTLHAAILDAPWDDQSEADARRASDRIDGPAESVAADREAMKANRHAALNLDGRRVGTLVYEIEDGVELFVVALVAVVPGIDLLALFEAKVCDLARALGCKSIRYGTSRPGMVEKTKALGYRVSGVVMRKSL